MAENLSTPEHRAQRLKHLRKLLGLSRPKLGELAGVSFRNLENWEYARFKGLSVKGAEKIVLALKTLHCHCSMEWLLNGMPPAPRLNVSDASPGMVINPTAVTLEQIEEELLLLKKHQSNLIIHQMTTQEMEPIFYAGDYLAGMAVALNEPTQFLTKPCIVQLADHSMLVRRVMKGATEHHFNLVAQETEATPEPYIYNIKPLLIAPIVWLRRFISPDYSDHN